MSKIKESKGFRVFGRLVGRQESIAMLYVVIMMVPNVLLTITERYPFSVTLAALLWPAAFYALLMAALRKPGTLMLVSLPLMILGAFQIVLLYLFGGSIIAVDNMEINPYDRVVVFAMPASVGKVGYFFN